MKTEIRKSEVLTAASISKSQTTKQEKDGQFSRTFAQASRSASWNSNELELQPNQQHTPYREVSSPQRGKRSIYNKVARHMAENCVPMLLKAMGDQYHYTNTNIGPDEVIPALLSDARNIQITALVDELADNGHDVSGIVREVEVMRYYILECAKRMAAIATHVEFIEQQTKVQ